MKKIRMFFLLWVLLGTVACKDLFVITKNNACGAGASQTSPSGECLGPLGYDPVYPPVFYHFYKNISENVISFDSLLEVALVDREPKPPRGQFFLVLLPDADQEIVYSAKVRMGVDPNSPNLSTEITAWASKDGRSLSEQLGSTSVTSGKSVVFPDYSGGKKYIVKSSFRWLIFIAKYKGENTQVSTESFAQLYMGYNW